ncbi:hypothetical protein HWV23_13950 [Natronomonas halophila]|uniref:hypothetical protein n=1 Tax=Natronomonas halophila TaxID=2747817 RepID=UPI0015B584FD|nr:hypothetical protein [Natronomonas halophila]QLD86784.1 hypothetical protein HWV23_13950 [Natronomonas halophila]
MVSRENRVIVGFVLAAMVLGFGVTELTALPSEASLGILLVVGVVAPILVNNYLDAAGSD